MGNSIKLALFLTVVLLVFGCGNNKRASKTTPFLCIYPHCQKTENKLSNLRRILDVKPYYPKGTIVRETKIIVSISATYPREAAINGTEGEVTIVLTVSKDGSVKNPIVLESLPIGVFDSAALKAIARFKFSPRVVNGIVEEAKVKYLYSFRLVKI